MSTIKNGQILLYCHFNKLIKGPGTSFQSQALSQKHVRNAFHTAHFYILQHIIFFVGKNNFVAVVTFKVLKIPNFSNDSS